MKIPLCKPSIDQKELSIVRNSISSGWLTHGSHNLKFEDNFNKLIGSKYSVSMNSCTSALESAIKCLEIKGEIIVPSFTWVSSANAIMNSGCQPVFADINLDTRNIDPLSIEKLISKKTKAVMVVHFAGLPCDMTKIINICKKYKLHLIEDSAETLGAKYNGKYTGSFGIGCFSFFPTKNITTTEGGMLTTNNKKIYNKVKKLIAHGIQKSKKNFWERTSVLAGHNYRLPNHLAALGNSQLKKLRGFNKRRNLIANMYTNELNKYDDLIITPTIPNKCTHSFQMYTIRILNNLRNKFVYFLNNKGINASVHFDPPLHKQKLYSKFKYKNLKNTNILSKEIVSLPIYPDLSDKEVKYIINIISMWYKKIKN